MKSSRYWQRHETTSRSPLMLLAIDAGNSDVKLGVFQGPQVLKTWRLNRDELRTTDEYGVQVRSLFDLAGLDAQKVEAVIISCAVFCLKRTSGWLAAQYSRRASVCAGPSTHSRLPCPGDYR